jgi:hypothetical protein
MRRLRYGYRRVPYSAVALDDQPITLRRAAFIANWDCNCASERRSVEKARRAGSDHDYSNAFQAV